MSVKAVERRTTRGRRKYCTRTVVTLEKLSEAISKRALQVIESGVVRSAENPEGEEDG